MRYVFIFVAVFIQSPLAFLKAFVVWISIVTDNLSDQNQDPVVGQYTPLLGIDAWEHVSEPSSILVAY